MTNRTPFKLSDLVEYALCEFMRLGEQVFASKGDWRAFSRLELQKAVIGVDIIRSLKASKKEGPKP